MSKLLFSRFHVLPIARLIVATFIMIIVNFYLSDGVAVSRRVCPKIVHGKNSSYELYHQRKGKRHGLHAGHARSIDQLS
jgi:hypothetical protein